MGKDLIARSQTDIAAPARAVWAALTDPDAIHEYMFGARVEAQWRVGGQITWRGEWQGTPYEDRGTVLALEPERLLQYTHFSPRAGVADEPQDYHTVTIQLRRHGGGIRVTLTQDNNPSEAARAHAERNWSSMLEALKRYVERTLRPQADD